MRHCYIVRVFTIDGAGGNGLGVVTDVTGLDPAVMQQVATDLGFSETIFVDWREEGTPRARIFTPATELPFAGHPLVGAGWVLNAMGPGCGRIECGIGEVAIERQGDRTWVTVPAERPVREGGLDVSGWVDPIGASTVEMPLEYHLLQLSSPEEVAELDPARCPPGREVYVWAWEEEGRAVKARFFADGVGVAEDPATGSAAVALASALRAVGTDEGELVVHQGAEIGSPSAIELRWSRERIGIGGEVVRDEVRVLEL